MFSEQASAAEASTSFKKQPHETVCFLKEALARDDFLVALGHLTRKSLGDILLIR